MTTIMRKAGNLVLESEGMNLQATSSNSHLRDSVSQYVSNQVKVVTPPPSALPSASPPAVHNSSAGLALLSAAAENQVVEDIVDDVLKDVNFDLKTCKIQSFRTV